MPTPDFSGCYRSSSDASMRHRNTYIALRDTNTGLLKPHYVREVEGSRTNPILHLRSLTGDELTRRMGDNDVVMQRPTICMVNYRCGRTHKMFAVWHESLAGRQIKRSLDLHLLSKHVLGKRIINEYTTCNVTGDSEANNKRMVQTFYNKEFPSFRDALVDVSSGRSFSVAFSERFALVAHRVGGIVIFYKENIVGYMGETHPILFDRYQYLQEQLGESAHGNV